MNASAIHNHFNEPAHRAVNTKRTTVTLSNPNGAVATGNSDQVTQFTTGIQTGDGFDTITGKDMWAPLPNCNVTGDGSDQLQLDTGSGNDRNVLRSDNRFVIEPVNLFQGLDAGGINYTEAVGLDSSTVDVVNQISNTERGY